MTQPMKVLVACEFSGVVRRAFRELGHDAWSYDLLASADGSPHHIEGDAVEVTRRPGWNLIIAHPPCTYLCNSGVHHLHTEEGRWQKMSAAARFFWALYYSPCERIAVENPVPHKYGIGKTYTQTIQPWQFGHGETKRTCLWLRGLPKLVPTDIVEGREARVHKASPGPDRWKIRSLTYPGIAAAMAEQWGGGARQQKEAV